LQSSLPAAQTGGEQVASVQEGATVPGSLGHARPHAPQFAGSVSVEISQPFAALASQSRKPAKQLVTRQLLATHAQTALPPAHARLHMPQ
jgi:hypothetical protein